MLAVPLRQPKKALEKPMVFEPPASAPKKELLTEVLLKPVRNPKKAFPLPAPFE